MFPLELAPPLFNTTLTDTHSADDNEYTLEYLLSQPKPVDPADADAKQIESREQAEEDVDMEASEGEWEGVQSGSDSD